MTTSDTDSDSGNRVADFLSEEGERSPRPGTVTDFPRPAPPPEPDGSTDKPPQRRRGRPPGSKNKTAGKAPLPKFVPGQISGFVERVYKALGGIALMNGDPEIRIIGQGFIDCAEAAGIAWEKVAKRNEIVRRFFDRIMTTSDLGELFWAHLPILVPLVQRFGPLRSTISGLQEEFEEEFQKAEAS